MFMVSSNPEEVLIFRDSGSKWLSQNISHRAKYLNSQKGKKQLSKISVYNNQAGVALAFKRAGF